MIFIDMVVGCYNIMFLNYELVNEPAGKQEFLK